MMHPIKLGHETIHVLEFSKHRDRCLTFNLSYLQIVFVYHTLISH